MEVCSHCEESARLSARSAWLLGVAAALAALLFAALGCSNIPSLDADVLPPEEAEPLEEPAVRYTVGVLPVHVDSDFEERRVAVNGGASEDHRRVMPLVPEARRVMMEEAVEAVQSLDAVRKIRMLEAVRPRELELALDTAWAQGLDLVVRPVLRRHDAYHVKTSGSYVPMLVVWMALSPIPTWWWAYERFGADVSLALEVYATAHRSVDPLLVEEFASSLDYRFNDFDQGFNLFNPFRTPGGMSEGQWERVASRLLPLARREAQRELVRYLRDVEAGLAAELAELGEERLHKSLALLIGRNALNPQGRQLAEADVARLRDALLERGEDGASWMQPWMIELLDGPRVTRDSVQLALEHHLVERMRDGDHALLVLALHGVWDEEGEPWLVLGDTPGQRISVASLGETLAELPGHVAVVAAVNWVETSESPVGPDTADWPWERLATLPNVALFAATAGPFQPVLEVEQLPGSVFLGELSRVLREAAGESQLSLSEISQALTPEIQRLARREGVSQAPVLVGAEQVRTGAFFRAAATGAQRDDDEAEEAYEETAAWPPRAE